MRYFLLVIPFLLLFNNSLFSQKEKPFQLKNVVIVALQNELSDRYSVEIALLQLFNDYNIKSKAALNVIKQEGSPNILESDSIQKILKNKGFDTYLLVSVRGYDQRFKPSGNIPSFEEELNAGHLYPVYRENASRVTFTFIFYRNGEPVYQELIRTGSVSSKETTIKKLMRKTEKKLVKNWL